MNASKYKKTVFKIFSDNDFVLVREKKHFVFAHKITNRKVVCPKTTKDHRSIKNTIRHIKHAQQEYLPRVA